MNSLRDDLKALLRALIWYSKRKTIYFGKQFEKFKNRAVEALMHGRGTHQKRVWHGSILALAFVGIFTSGVFGGTSLVSATYPGIGDPDPRFASTYEPYAAGVVTGGSQDPHTNISEKPRSEIIDYKVQSGDTLSTIAQKYGVSTATLKWANDLTDVNAVKPGDTLKILPVTGVAVTVKSGDTLASISKKYQADSQAIVDFPFNDIPDDFSLKPGQTLILPDGQPPEAPPVVRVQPRYVAAGAGANSPTFSVAGGGNFIWPTHFVYVSQYYAWYHPGLDLPNPGMPPVVAADGGTVVYAGWDTTGYGNRVDISHGNGYLTRYAHLSNIYVSNGQTVSRGETLGQMGSTGRSTGTHLHFEIHYNGIAINPLNILK